MTYIRRAKDKQGTNKRKKNQDRFENDTIISYKKSKKRIIRRYEAEKIPLILGQGDCR